VAGPCEHGNETSDSINGGEFLAYLSDYQFLNVEPLWDGSVRPGFDSG
jgi:hypothetical protein